MKYSTDPKVIGPGTWFTLQTAAWNARTKEEIKFFIKMLRATVDTFPCGDCRKHAQQYLAQNSPESDKYANFEYEGKKLGMFLYMVEFHNWPNKRLGKPIVSFTEAYNAHNTGDMGFCAEGCAEDNEQTQYTQYPGVIPTLSSTGKRVSQFNNYIRK